MYKCWEVNSNQRENIANLGNLLTQQSRELRQEKQEEKKILLRNYKEKR